MKVNTVDMLREACKLSLMASGVPVVLDEITPSNKRGSRLSMSLDDVKRLVEVEESTTVDGRSNDIQFFPDQAKIFTTNAATPKAWLRDLPADLEALTNEERKSLDFSVKAVIKRAMFATISTCMVPDAVRVRFRSNRRGDAAAKIRRLSHA